jgi:predicted RNase H-like HicB family nuclease
MTDEQFEELQSDLSDINTRHIDDHLSCAGCCETKEDFVTNLDSAIESAKELLVELKNILKESKKNRL